MRQEHGDFRGSLFLGRWTYCGPSTLFGQAHDGIELVADGTWYFLYSDGSGGLVRGAGFDGGGDWTVLADNNYQVNLSVSDGMNYLFAAFQTDPMSMRLKWMGGTADYVKTGPNGSTTDGGEGAASDAPL